jgi:hypothetical protein
MAISYPLSLPTQAGIANVTLRAANVVALSQSPFTFRQQVFKHPGERWEATVTLPSMARANAESWLSFLLALKGQTGTFLLGDPANAEPRGSLRDVSTWFLAGGVWQNSGFWDDNQDWDGDPSALVFGSPFVSSQAQLGASSINISGVAANTQGLLLAGDYIQLGSAGTASLHKVLLPVNSDSSGNATLEIWPSLRRTVAQNETVFYRNPVGRFRLDSNSQIGRSTQRGFTKSALTRWRQYEPRHRHRNPERAWG